MNIIQPWRQLYEIKQVVLAREAGIHAVSLSRIENGAEPTVTNALNICDALSRLSRPHRDIGVKDVFYRSEHGADSYAAWDAREQAADEVHRQAEQQGRAWTAGRLGQGES